jgi:hypothetical protein
VTHLVLVGGASELKEFMTTKLLSLLRENNGQQQPGGAVAAAGGGDGQKKKSNKLRVSWYNSEMAQFEILEVR